MQGCRGHRLTVVAACMFVALAESKLVPLNNGVQMPSVSLGTAEYNESELEQAILTAVQTGFRGIDTAFNYYNQVSVGRGLKKANRTDLFLVTKTSPCFHPQAPPHYNITDPEACKAQTRRDVESNFEQLGVDVIDLLLLHGANHFGAGACGDASCALNTAQWEVYEDVLRTGRVRAIGVSNYCQSCLACLMASARVVPAVNQVKYHPGMTADPDGLVSFCQQRGIVPMAYSPLSGVIGDPLMESIAKSHGKTSAQVALKWIVDKGYTLATASSNPKHLAEDIDLYSWGLSSQEAARIDAYSRGSDLPSWACTAAADVAVVV